MLGMVGYLFIGSDLLDGGMEVATLRSHCCERDGVRDGYLRFIGKSG